MIDYSIKYQSLNTILNLFHTSSKVVGFWPIVV